MRKHCIHYGEFEMILDLKKNYPIDDILNYYLNNNLELFSEEITVGEL